MGNDPFLHAWSKIELIEVKHLCNEIGLNQGRKQRETLPNIQCTLVSVHIYSSHFNIVPWPRLVNIVSKQNYLLTAGNTARQDLTWWFLECQFLIVSINSFLFVDLIRSIDSTRTAGSNSDIVDIIDKEWTLICATFRTFVNYLLQLIENLTSNRHNALY